MRSVYTHVYMYMYVCVYVFWFMYMHMHMYMFINTHACTCENVYARKCVQGNVLMHVSGAYVRKHERMHFQSLSHAYARYLEIR